MHYYIVMGGIRLYPDITNLNGFIYNCNGMRAYHLEYRITNNEPSISSIPIPNMGFCAQPPITVRLYPVRKMLVYNHIPKQAQSRCHL